MPCTNTTSNNVPFTAPTTPIATVGLVDEETRRNLVTPRTIRTPMIVHAENTKGAIPLLEMIEVESKR